MPVATGISINLKVSQGNLKGGRGWGNHWKSLAVEAIGRSETSHLSSRKLVLGPITQA